MVSGFFTSPCDHCRILSGLASEMRIAENDSGSFGFSKKLKMSFTSAPWRKLFENQKASGPRAPGVAAPEGRSPRSRARLRRVLLRGGAARRAERSAQLALRLLASGLRLGR